MFQLRRFMVRYEGSIYKYIWYCTIILIRDSEIIGQDIKCLVVALKKNILIVISKFILYIYIYMYVCIYFSFTPLTNISSHTSYGMYVFMYVYRRLTF